MSNVKDLSGTLISTSRLLAGKGLVVGSAGNVSARLDPSSFLITPTGLRYESLTPQDLVVIGIDGRVVSGSREASKEVALHLAVYMARLDARAIVHTHSPYASALAVNWLGLPAVVDELIFKTGGPVRVAEYGYPGSEDLARKIVGALENRQAVIIANHGVLCVGASLHEALEVCEVVEETAKIYVLARSLGQVHELAPEVIERQQAAFQEKNRRESSAGRDGKH